MTLHWIDTSLAGRLAIMARPRAGDWLPDEIERWKSEGVQTVVSLLTADEIYELGLDDEAGLCRAQGMAFLSFPIVDRGLPHGEDDAPGLARQLAEELRSGNAIAVHCRAGIGRASMIAALILTTVGLDPTEAFEKISTARRLPVPDTDAQREWVISWAASREA